MAEQSINQDNSRRCSTDTAPWEAAHVALQTAFQRDLKAMRESFQSQMQDMMNLLRTQAEAEVNHQPYAYPAPPPLCTQEPVFDPYYEYPPTPQPYAYPTPTPDYYTQDPYYEYPPTPQPYAYQTPTPDDYTQEPIYEPSHMYPPETYYMYPLVPQPYVYPEPPSPPYEPQPIPSSYYPYVEQIFSIDDDPISLVGSEEDEGFHAGNQVLHDNEPDDVVDVIPEVINDVARADVDECIAEIVDGDSLLTLEPMGLTPEAQIEPRETIVVVHCTNVGQVCSFVNSNKSLTDILSMALDEEMILFTTSHPSLDGGPTLYKEIVDFATKCTRRDMFASYLSLIVENEGLTDLRSNLFQQGEYDPRGSSTLSSNTRAEPKPPWRAKPKLSMMSN